MPYLLFLAGVALAGGVAAGYVVTGTGEVVKQPAVQALGVAAVLYAAHLILRDIR